MSKPLRNRPKSWLWIEPDSNIMSWLTVSEVQLDQEQGRAAGWFYLVDGPKFKVRTIIDPRVGNRGVQLYIHRSLLQSEPEW